MTQTSLTHTTVTQQCVDSGPTAAKRLERFERRAAAADCKNLVAESQTGAGVEHAVLFEQAVGVRGEHLGPFITIVTGSVSSREDVREIIEEAVVLRRNDHGDFRPNLVEELQWWLRLCGVVVLV